MVQLKDIVMGLFSRYYWGIALVGGLLCLLALVTLPNLDYILPKFGIETKASLLQQRNALTEQVSQMKQINEQTNNEILNLQRIHEEQIQHIAKQKSVEIIYQEKIKVIKEKIPTPKSTQTSDEEALQYHTLLTQAHKLATGEV